jgi:hypothetical protein
MVVGEDSCSRCWEGRGRRGRAPEYAGPPPEAVRAGLAAPRVGKGAPALPPVGEEAPARPDADPRCGQGSHRRRPLFRMG